jgi:hypothetical protein
VKSERVDPKSDCFKASAGNVTPVPCVWGWLSELEVRKVKTSLSSHQACLDCQCMIDSIPSSVCPFAFARYSMWRVSVFAWRVGNGTFSPSGWKPLNLTKSTQSAECHSHSSQPEVLELDWRRWRVGNGTFSPSGWKSLNFTKSMQSAECPSHRVWNSRSRNPRTWQLNCITSWTGAGEEWLF